MRYSKKAQESEAKLAKNAENGTTVKLRFNRWGWVNKFGKEIYGQKHLQIVGGTLVVKHTSETKTTYVVRRNNSAVARTIIGGHIFIYSCSYTIKTIDFKRN